MTRSSYFRITSQNGEVEFRCMQCHRRISTDPRLAGVKNRNHCPYCLWSRHMDLHHPGDRLAACRAKMQPLGLTLKTGNKKYSSTANGELMLIHICSECGKISINRIAADDDPRTILTILEVSTRLDEQRRRELMDNGIQVLRQPDQQVVMVRLFGSLQPGWAG